jgi:serine O-acetyltransferase
MLYYRFGTPKSTVEKILLALVKKLYKPRGTIRIETPSIGPGILIMHGVGTVIQAERIGEHLLIFQEVVIAPKMDGLQGRPVIGNDVRISAGAKIIGPVTIGDHSIIGPNAVVTKDVPPKCIAVGVPARNVPMERR